MGALFGGLLQEAGYPVVLLDVDPVHIAAINDHGLYLRNDAGERHIPVRAARAREVTGPVDLLLVFTKANQTIGALESARHLIGPGTWAMTVQNGLDTGSRIVAVVPERQIAVGMTNWPAELLGPGRVASHGAGEVRLWSQTGQPDAMLERIAAALSRAGLRCSLDPQVQVAIWEKVAFNAAMNAIAAVSGLNVGQMADSQDIRAIAAAVVAETVAIARAAGVAVEEPRIRAAMEHAYATHREHQPSMLQDILAGRRTEIDAINGAIVARAEQQGLHAPVIQTLARLVRAMESSRR